MGAENHVQYGGKQAIPIMSLYHLIVELQIAYKIKLNIDNCE